MEYFYAPPEDIAESELTIAGEEFSHLTHVMRKQVGDRLMVTDGAGSAYEATITEIVRRSARCSIQARHRMLHEPQVRLILGVGVLKNGSKFDFLVEKTTELGVHAIVPLLTSRTIPRHAKTDRWRKIALAAMKQSGRSVLPRIHPVTPLAEFLEGDWGAHTKILPYEKATTVWRPKFGDGPSGDAVLACIGPEGGFTDEEVDQAVRRGFQTVSLGERRLRTETAAIVTTAALLA
jgi:16S rRNA (uracil1498-N3)-methyltransferase